MFDLIKTTVVNKQESFVRRAKSIFTIDCKNYLTDHKTISNPLLQMFTKDTMTKKFQSEFYFYN